MVWAAGLAETLLTDTGLAIAVVVALAILTLVALTARRRWITRNGGTFECCYAAGTRTRFRRGIAVYAGDRLRCFRWLSLSSSPGLVLDRSDVVSTTRRDPRAGEAYFLGVDNPVVVTISWPEHSAQLALDESSLTGLLAWVEAAPPRPFHLS